MSAGKGKECIEVYETSSRITRRIGGQLCASEKSNFGLPFMLRTRYRHYKLFSTAEWANVETGRLISDILAEVRTQRWAFDSSQTTTQYFIFCGMKATSTLQGLPNELLIDIFKQSDNPQIRLVCRGFHDIINSTSSFWSFIYIGPEQYTPQAPTFLKRRLERSASRPLDVFIRNTEPSIALAAELWNILSIHRRRIHTFDIGTDTWILSGQIMHAILLSLEPSPLPSLTKLDIRYDEEQDPPDRRAPMEPHVLLRPIATLFPTLTTLVLPLMLPCIPFPDSPILSLKTLVLDGSVSYCCDYLWIVHIANLLVKTPNLEVFWCKEHRVYTHEALSELNSHPPDMWGSPRVYFPVVLPKLTKMALGLPGLGYDLLHVIEAPALQDLHMDGIRADDWFAEQVAWLSWFPARMRTALQITVSRSPGLRRLSLVGVYLSRETWEWLLGCDPATHDLPFPLLESIAVHQMRAVKDEVANTFDDELIELYARQGRLLLRRLVYLASEPPLGGLALRRLAMSVSERKIPGQNFNLVLDKSSVIDANVGFASSFESRIKLVCHEESPRSLKEWWNLGKDIEPTEEDSY
ncbi:hypothetical protein BDN70DRAFT_890391 [Pholiota conissans]|uniref:F-box domain-containing protein n=1 Tax=Pholiota conissans TaxID=109636 RepID=A0A9P5ZE01_9AGAR|nr:hypothetical protein BDN70DRAFT_890391 [Pholiota conissans]